LTDGRLLCLTPLKKFFYVYQGCWASVLGYDTREAWKLTARRSCVESEASPSPCVHYLPSWAAYTNPSAEQKCSSRLFNVSRTLRISHPGTLIRLKNHGLCYVCYCRCYIQSSLSPCRDDGKAISSLFSVFPRRGNPHTHLKEIPVLLWTSHRISCVTTWDYHR